MDNYLDIVTSFALYNGLNDKPIRKALESHNANKKIRNLYIVSESKIEELTYLLNGLDDLHIHFIEVESRPTFDILISHVNHLIEAKTSKYVALMNGDVSFEDVKATNNAIRIFNQQTLLANSVIVLSRHEYINGVAKMVLNLDNGLPNFMSADAWIFNHSCHLKNSAFYNMGQMNCDLMLAYDLVASGYEIINPCLDTVIIHHEDELKSDLFYAEQNVLEKNINAGYQHQASRVNLPFIQFGIPWLKSKWLEFEYNPHPYKFVGKDAIWIVLNHYIEESTDKFVLMVLEVIAKATNRDLVLLIEGEINDQVVNYYHNSLRLNRNIYLLSVDNLNNYITSALSGEFIFYDSFIILSDLSRLTKIILSEYSGIFLDLRNIHFITNLIILDKDGLGIDVNWHLKDRYIDEFFVKTISKSQLNHSRKCSLITSVYKTDEFVETFIANCKNLIGYENIDHYFLLSSLSAHEKKIFSQVLFQHRNAIFVWYRKDPGLYECWNKGIKLAVTEYVSNANVDDLRDINHVKNLISDLETNQKFAFAASALHPFYKFSGDLHTHQIEDPWYSDQQGEIKFHTLGNIEKKEDGKYRIKPHNLPHCMPVWRKSLHEKYGFFDEATFGTFADWAFWLKVTLNDEIGYLNGKGMGYYYVNLESHNRRGDQLKMFHQRVEKEFLPHFLLSGELYSQLHGEPKIINSILEHKQKDVGLKKKINIHGLELSYGEHRNSYNRLAESLLPLHTNNDAILFLPFIERYFVWGDQPGEANSTMPAPITQNWIGIIHVPFDAPKWFHTDVSPEIIFETELWKKSFPSCKGLITLSEDLERDINFYFPGLPTFSLKHPTEFDDLQQFNLTHFNENPTLVQAGDWLRKLQTIHRVDAPNYRRVMLKKTYTDNYLVKEREVFGDYSDSNVEIYTMIPNDEYDALLSSSVVICWLYATAANNLILECIARKTPILINPLPSVVEYLGENYPLYFNDLSEANLKLENKELIKEAHEYLSDSGFIDIYSYKRFFENFSQSEFYRNL